MRLSPFVQAEISRALLEQCSIPGIDSCLRGAGVSGHIPYQDVFLDACITAEEKAQMVLYIHEVGVEHMASIRFLGDGEVSKYHLRDLYTLQLIWPSSNDRLRHPADNVFERLAADRDRFQRDLARARSRSQELVQSEGKVLLSRFNGLPNVESPTGRWRLLVAAFAEYMPEIEGLTTSKGAVGDLKPFLSIPLAHDWVLVAYFQRAAAFARAGAGSGFDIQAAVTRRAWISEAAGRIPIPHGMHRLYFREAIHGLRGAYLSADSAALTLAAVRSYALALLQVLPALGGALAAINADAI